MKKRYICLSDFELTVDRLDVAGKILEDLTPKIKGADRVFFLGDLYRDFRAATVFFATSWFQEIASITKEPPLFVVGNHDIEIGPDRISASLRSIGLVASSPVVIPGDNPIAVLPSPNRATFGAVRGPEGKRARDAALSQAIEAAVISLETQIGPERLGESILLFHGAIAGSDLGKNVLSPGLTWEIPAERLGRFGLAIGGHIHQPQQIGANAYYVGGVANWQFTDRAERFRALVIDTGPDGFKVSDIPLLRPLVQIEMEIDETGLHGATWPPYSAPLGQTFADHVLGALVDVCGINPQVDAVALRIRARLPGHEMKCKVPTEESLLARVNEDVQRTLLQSVTIAREVTGLHKARIETTTPARQMTLEELLGLYVRTIEAESGVKQDAGILDLAKGLLGKVADSYRPSEGNFGFKPLTLEVKNFRQWQSATIDFSALGGAVVLSGPNESGKSNLLESMLFALYKRSPSSAATIDEELRKGEQAGTVVLTFESHSETYKVSRALERGRGGVTCKSEFMRWTGDEPTMWEPVSETANDIDKRIAELVGSYDFLRWLIFRSQRDLDRLIEATPADWHKIALQTFNLNAFELVRKRAASEAENSKLRGEQAATRLDEVREQVTTEKAALEELPGVVTLATAKAAYDAEIISYRDKRADLEAEKNALIDKRAAVREAINGRAKLEDQIRIAKRAISSLVPDSIGERPAVPTTDAAGIEAKAAETKARRDELLELDAAKAREINMATAEVENCEFKLKQIAAEIESIEAQIKALEESQGKLGESPCRSRGHEFDTFCPAWLYYSKADRGKELGVKREAAVTRWNEQEQQRMISYNILKALEPELASITAELTTIAPILRGLEAELGEYRNALHAAELWDEKAKANGKAREQKAAREKELGELVGQLTATEDASEALSGILKQLEAADNKLTAMDKLIEAAQAGKREKQGELDRLELYAKRIHEAEDKAEAYAAEVHTHGQQMTAWNLLAEAFHATGIPYLLLERNIGRVETVTNELLAGCGSDSRIRIETVTPTKKGEARDKLSIIVIDPRGEHPLCMASGEQGVIVSLALSPALSIAGAEFWGAVPELFIQDEGFERVDADHREMTRALIGEIGERFGRFLCISHLDWIKESADAELRVVAENGLSRLEAA